jgi:hypothetical protein
MTPQYPHVANLDFGHDDCGCRYDEYDDGEDRSCTICGGEPDMQECDDPIQCCDPKCDGQWHPCNACNGTGLAEHQWMW